MNLSSGILITMGYPDILILAAIGEFRPYRALELSKNAPDAVWGWSSDRAAQIDQGDRR
jgi:hypothetical protein